MRSEWGARLVPGAPVGVSPTGHERPDHSRVVNIFGGAQVFGETPNTATVTVALPIDE